ncbi:hypothetical protein D9758_007432 [Tetrapyrgos nigripes]|uniref:F-box domain-containing protein n=1 Tax=Tetrapyrgos nigripes TaxID=182062 RepID=A0A8H5LHH2_9AGAR|nr:hypothetical protein D9758_007432 [Tetrapyrgos nigripes]
MSCRSSGSKSSKTTKQSKPEYKGLFCPCGEKILFLKYDELQSDHPEEVLNTNEPLLDSLYAQEARRDIRAAKEMKKALAAHRRHLYKWASILSDERRHLNTFIDSRKSLISPMRTVPSEIITEIFKLVGRSEVTLPGDVIGYKESYFYTGPIWLAQVCRRWRNTAFSRPLTSLWSLIHINTFPGEGHTKKLPPLEDIEAAIARAQDAPLHLSFYYDHRRKGIDAANAFFNILCQKYSERWESIVFETNAKMDALSFTVGTFENLQTLSITSRSSYSADSLMSIIPTSLPKLIDIRIVNVDNHWSPPLFSHTAIPTAPELKRMEIPAHCGMSGRFLPILKRFPLLEEFSLTGKPQEYVHHYHNVLDEYTTMPSLTKLVTPYNEQLESLILPVLSSLTLNGKKGTSSLPFTLHQLFQRSGPKCHLTKLCITDVASLVDGGWCHFLHDLPTIEVFEFYIPQWKEQKDKDMIKAIKLLTGEESDKKDTPDILLPKLRELSMCLTPYSSSYKQIKFLQHESFWRSGRRSRRLKKSLKEERVQGSGGSLVFYSLFWNIVGGWSSRTYRKRCMRG